MELNVERVDRGDAAPEFALLVEIHTGSVRIRQGASLQIAVDGDSLVLDLDAQARSWWSSSPVRGEQARYPCDPALLRRLGAADTVSIVVLGTAWRERRALSPRNLAALQSFIVEHVPDSAEVPDRLRR
jgi:hypothetical protein